MKESAQGGRKKAATHNCETTLSFFKMPKTAAELALEKKFAELRAKKARKAAAAAGGTGGATATGAAALGGAGTNIGGSFDVGRTTTDAAAAAVATAGSMKRARPRR